MDVKLKMTLWYTLLAVATACVIGAFLIGGSRRVSERYYGETLTYAALVAQEELEYESGELEIDDDLNEVPDVHISLYTQSGTLVYGRSRVSLPFVEGEVRTTSVGNESWYVLDTLLTFDWRTNVWLRCVKRAEVEDVAFGPVLRLALILLPLMIILTALGGYFIACKAFKPVKEMAHTAGEIANGGDLQKRVGLHSGSRDELTALANTLDGMLERLEQAFSRERQFTSDAAHELRTPLNAMRLLCDNALHKPDGEEKDALIAELSERVNSLSVLVAQLLSLSRMEAGRETLHKQTASLSDIVLNVAGDIQPVAEDAGIVLKTGVENGIDFDCDPSMITLMVANLLSNAVRYGKRGGQALLSLKREENGIMLSIKDDGVGISQEDLPHIWERFWRADASRSSEGTGLGMAIAKWVIDSHNGKVDVESKLGEGTKIKIKFSC